MQAKTACVSALKKKKQPVVKIASRALAATETACCAVSRSFENMSAVGWTLKWKSIMLAWAAENMETIDHVHCTVN